MLLPIITARIHQVSRITHEEKDNG
jgi:hypothetical protein